MTKKSIVERFVPKEPSKNWIILKSRNIQELTKEISRVEKKYNILDFSYSCNEYTYQVMLRVCKKDDKVTLGNLLEVYDYDVNNDKLILKIDKDNMIPHEDLEEMGRTIRNPEEWNTLVLNGVDIIILRGTKNDRSK